MKRKGGGQPGHTVSAETRAKISAKLKARQIPPDERAAQLENLAKGRTEEAFAVRRGRPLTPEHRASISAGHRAKKESEICAVPECDGPNKSKGFCAKHYSRLVRYGDPSTEPRRAEVRYGAEGYNWRGDDAGYSAVHLRMKKLLPSICALLDETCKGRLEVAFRGHDTPLEFWLYHEGKGRTVPYSTKPEHYWRLCRSHHVRLDHGKLDLS